MRVGFACLALFFALCGVARAGAYDVMTCSPNGPGGVNNAWAPGPVMTVSGASDPVTLAGVSVTGSCAEGGPMIRSGVTQSFSYWGVMQDFVFRAPAGTLITKLALWRDG